MCGCLAKAPPTKHRLYLELQPSKQMGTAEHARPDGHIPLLEKYPSALMHLHQQRLLRRLCCVFGAGASVDVGMAGWSDFISELATGLGGLKEVEGSKRDLIARAQELFYSYSSQYDAAMAGKAIPRPGPEDPTLAAARNREPRRRWNSNSRNCDSQAVDFPLPWCPDWHWKRRDLFVP
jgi:hypothetical protein